MATFNDALQVYRNNRRFILETGLNRVLQQFIMDGCCYTPAVLQMIVIGEHQQRLIGKPHFSTMFSSVQAALSKILPLKYQPRDFEQLYDMVDAVTSKIYGLGSLTVYDMALRIGFIQETPILPEKFVYTQSGALTGARQLTISPDAAVLGRRTWSTNRYDLIRYFPGFGSMESMYIEDFLCVFHNELANLRAYTIRDLQNRLRFIHI